MNSNAAITWLLDTDPAIRWQTLRDLTDTNPATVAAERAKVPQAGWAAALLAQQTPEGTWQGDDFTMMVTIYSLALLREMGVDPRDERVRQAVARVERLRWEEVEGEPFFDGETEPCINGVILATGAYFGVRNDALLSRLLSEQLPDGGWNCRAPESQRSSFHTTICVLEGLLETELAFGGARTHAARERAEEYLLERHLCRRRSNGTLIEQDWSRFRFPTFWHYDLLRGLDYLRRAGRTPDDRVREAVEAVRAQQLPDGRWPWAKPIEDLIPFRMETQEGTASPWNTLRALRVLRWAGALD